MIIVTGGAGFIGSNIVKGLNDRGIDDILVVDNLTNMVKFKNIQGLKVKDYMGDVNAIVVDRDHGVFYGAHDPRSYADESAI